MRSIMQPSLPSLREVAAPAADGVGGRDPLVADHRAEPKGGVDQYVAVEHPQPGVVGEERALPRLARPDEDRVEVHGAARERPPVLADHRVDVAVEVDRVVLVGVVDEPEAYELPIPDDDRLCVRKGPSVE